MPEEDKFPNKEKREGCWNAKDKYWDCLKATKQDYAACQELRKTYEQFCSQTWVRHSFICTCFT